MAARTVDIYGRLRTAMGPTRFAQVDERLYRGGQPTPEQVRLLHDLGVRTIVSLRSGDDAGRAEEAAARALGMRFVRLAFSALRAPDGGFLRQVVGEIRGSDGPVYVHCAAGRDRTSLVVALYRVWVQNWEPDTAWQREALDFGHGRMIWFRGLDRLFAQLTRP